MHTETRAQNIEGGVITYYNYLRKATLKFGTGSVRKNPLLTLFTKKCKMLHCNPRMKITSEKKGTFYSQDMNKKFQKKLFPLQ